MKRWPWIAGLLLGALAAPAELPPASYAALSAVATGPSFVVQARDRASAEAGVRQVLRIQAEICTILATSAPPPARVLWFTERIDWTNCLAAVGFPDTDRSLAGADYIAIHSTSNDAGEALAHEMVHAALKQTAFYPLPLWLEEGFALFTGWRVASAIARRDGLDLQRSLPALQETDLLPLDRVLLLRDYPAPPAENRAFYRQAEELVRYLVERHGDEGFRLLARRMAKGDSLQHCLERRFNYGEENYRRLEAIVRSRSTNKQAW